MLPQAGLAQGSRIGVGLTEQQRDERLHYHMYESLEGIREQSERIVELEDIAVGLYNGADAFCSRVVVTCDRCPFKAEGTPCNLTKAYSRLREMGVKFWK